MMHQNDEFRFKWCININNRVMLQQGNMNQPNQIAAIRCVIVVSKSTTALEEWRWKQQFG